MTQDTHTPTEEKEEELSDFAAWSIAIIIFIFSTIGIVFTLYYSDEIAGFVFKPWMQEDTEKYIPSLNLKIEHLRYEISQCADPNSIARGNYSSVIIYQNNKQIEATSTQKTLEDCLKNL